MTDISDFEDWLRTQDYSANTVRGYRADLRRFTAWFEMHTGVPLTADAVSTRDLRVYREYMLESGLADSTINRRLDALRTYLKWAQSSGLRADNPAGRLRRLKQNQVGNVRWLDGRQQSALRRAVERSIQVARLRYKARLVTWQRDAAILFTLLHTGLRVSELTALRMDDLSLGERRGELLVRAGKGCRQRRVPLNAEARRILRAWLDVRPEDSGEYLFPPLEHGKKGGRLSTRSVQRTVRRFGEQAGVPDVTPHVLRHTFAKNLVDAGVSLEKVAALLGHSNLNTTRIYITPSQQDLEKAVDELCWE